MKLSLDALLVLESIHRNGSFAAAAEELHRVRSALSYTVQTLERDLDVSLFDRKGHRAKLTEIGKVLLEEGKELLQTADNLERRIKRLKSGWEEEIYFAVDDLVSVPKLFPILEAYYQECTLTRLHISSEMLSACWDALVSGRVDLAIGVAENAPRGHEYGLIRLGQIKFVFAVSPKHPLAPLKKPLKNSDLEPYRSIIAGDTSRKLPARSSSVSSGEENLIVSSMQVKIAAQVQGLGVGYLPLHLISSELSNKQLVIKRVENEKPALDLALAWRINEAGKAVEWFIEKFKNPKIVQLLLNN